MSENEELDPALLQRLRDVPPASASIRDAHIAAALAEMAPTRRSSAYRTRILGGVAAALVLAVGGVAFANQQNDSRRGTLNGAVTTTVVKGGADCLDEFAGLQEDASNQKEFVHNGKKYALMFHDGNIDVYEATKPCNKIGALEYHDAMVARGNETSVPDTNTVCSYTTELLAQFNDEVGTDSFGLVLVQTDSGLSVHFKDRCNEPIASLVLP